MLGLMASKCNLRPLRTVHVPGHAVQGQCVPRGMVSPSPDSLNNLEHLQQSRGLPLRLRRQLSMPLILYKEYGCTGPQMARLCFKCSLLHSEQVNMLSAFPDSEDER